MIRLKTILHPTDFSEDSRYAMEVACALARDQAARVILLHIQPRSAPIGRDRGVPAYKEAHAGEDLAAYRDEMMERLQKMRAEAPFAQVDVMLKEGDVPGTIARTAEDTACDLVVMGTHGRSRMYEMTMGSVATEVTRIAPCPVVAVRVPAKASARCAAQVAEAANNGL